MHRMFFVAVVIVSLGATGACKKSGESASGTETPAPTSGAAAAKPGAAATNPHAAPTNPHGGSDPHGAMKPHAGSGKPSAATLGGGAPKRNADGTKQFGPFRVAVPKEWQERAPRSQMRAAEFRITAGGETANLVAYYFGKGGAGGVEANLARWYAEFQQTDGSATADKAKRVERGIGGLKVTTINVKGKYVAATRPGGDQKHNSPGHQMLAAIVDTGDGPYYFKLVGPETIVTSAEKPFEAMIASITVKAD